MSEEDRPPPWEKCNHKAAALYIHYCMHKDCQKWGSWGFSGRYGVEWFCFDHSYDGERTPMHLEQTRFTKKV